MWREGLFYKMIIAGIPNKIFQIIYSVYQDTRCRIKFSNGVGNEFFSTCGVKQGDVLSPLLFNFFIDDLVKKLNISNCDPVVIKNISVNSLLYADDIILLSNSENGLQRSLDVLNEFCIDWKLDVNHEKSKVMVFNSNGKSHVNILREKSLAIYFEDSQFRRNRTMNFIVSKIYVDKRSRVR